ncbi:MAG: hypothetical protein U5L09_10420 [Bacteroidales bacterium]|nr:hypothetical protein [Bacteroidales bacterium]
MKDKKSIQGFELLQINHAGAMQLIDGRTINYGVIRLTEKEVVYYTGKGLREMWKPKMIEEEQQRAAELKKISKEQKGEQKLIKSGHIAVSKYEEIARVMF